MNLNYVRYKCLKPLNSWKNKYLKYITNKQAQKYNLYNNTVNEVMGTYKLSDSQLNLSSSQLERKAVD